MSVAPLPSEDARAAAVGVRRFTVTRNRMLAELVILLLLIGWWWAAHGLPEFVLPAPGKVLKLSAKLLFDISPNWGLHTYASLARVLISTFLALVLGGLVALVPTYLKQFDVLVADRVIPFFNAFPSLGWALLAVLWFGVSNGSVIFVETAILLPFCMINMYEGMKSLDAEILEMAHSFTRARVRVLRKVVLPMLFPFIFSSLRVSYGVAWKVSLISELFGADTGLGYLMNRARQEFDTPLMFATIVAIIVMVYLVDKFCLARLETRFARGRI